MSSRCVRARHSRRDLHSDVGNRVGRGSEENILIFAIISNSYEEYACGVSWQGWSRRSACSSLTTLLRIIRHDRYLDEITSWDGKYILDIAVFRIISAASRVAV